VAAARAISGLLLDDAEVVADRVPARLPNRLWRTNHRERLMRHNWVICAGEEVSGAITKWCIVGDLISYQKDGKGPKAIAGKVERA
jgi:hypothetical protein